jgi:AcrR family transcriptional regulator
LADWAAIRNGQRGFQISALDNIYDRSYYFCMSKGTATRERILDQALRLASRDGLNGLSIGGLAEDLGLSKSGLFAHFGSKDELQLEVLQTASKRYETRVMAEAWRAPRGQPRIEKLFDLWIRWQTDPAMPGGCIFVAASVELDDQSGPAHDFLVEGQKKLLAALVQAARVAIEEGHFRTDLDTDQFAFELQGIILGFSHASRLLKSPFAEQRARAAFRQLLNHCQSPAS